MKFKEINNKLSEDMTMTQESFEEYMNYFKKQPNSEKQDIILDQLESLSSLANMMCEDVEAKNEPITNFNRNSNEDFNDSVITLINMIQNSLCNYNLKLYDSEDDK